MMVRLDLKLFFQIYLYLYLLQLWLYFFQHILIFIHFQALFFSYIKFIIFNYILHFPQFKNYVIGFIIYFYPHEHLQRLIAFNLPFSNILYMLMIFQFYFSLLFLIWLISQLDNMHQKLMQIYH